MSSLSPNMRGIVFMVLATGAFIVNDSFLKVVMERIPPFEALFLRALVAVLIGIPVLWVMGVLPRAKLVFAPRVAARNAFELIASAGYIFAIAFAPLADITALSQLTPMIVMLGVVVFFGDRIGRGAIGLIIVAFIGALMVAQPGGSGFQPFALLGLWNALTSATRDLLGRRIADGVPAIVVAVGASVVTLIGVSVLMLVFERFVVPVPMELLLVLCSSAFLTLGQLLLFSAYRVAQTSAILPFFYSGTIWALLAGALVFNTVPNPLALAGIGLILLSGVMVLLVDRRARRIEASVAPH
jgi:drug/metabolite transporter (DMT)-like permease